MSNKAECLEDVTLTIPSYLLALLDKVAQAEGISRSARMTAILRWELVESPTAALAPGIARARRRLRETGPGRKPPAPL